jgi:outer membrane protein OmpA-like peptidoglycan-associated protein
MKIGIDIKNKDTLVFVPKEQKQLQIPKVEPSILASEDLKLQQFEAEEMEPIFIEPEVIVEDTPKLPDPSVEYSLEVQKQPQKPTMAINKKYIVTYTKSETDVELSKTGKDFFTDLSNFMKKNPGCIIIIEGYNDDRGGSIRENQRLSILRAENAKQELINRGISSGRIVASGKGAIKNIASNETPAGRAKNRRIEIIIKQNKPPSNSR